MNKSNVDWKGDVLYSITLFSVACLILLLSSFSTKASYEYESPFTAEISAPKNTVNADLLNDNTLATCAPDSISEEQFEFFPEQDVDDLSITSGTIAQNLTDANGISVGSNLLQDFSLVSFTGRYLENKGLNVINWITASEVNTDYFILERSMGDGEFEVINKMDAKGNGSADALYRLDDIDISVSTTYTYRLKQMTNNGSEVISDIVSVFVKESPVLDPTVKVFSNSANDLVNVQIVKNISDVVSVKMFDLTGKMIPLSNVIVVADGNNAKLQIPVEGLVKAEYIIRVNVGDQVFAKKLSLVN